VAEPSKEVNQLADQTIADMISNRWKGQFSYAVGVTARKIQDLIDAAIREAVRAEREACAKACETSDYSIPWNEKRDGFLHGMSYSQNKCAALIRARDTDAAATKETT